MRNRDYIETLIRLIDSDFSQAKDENGFVDRAFFEREELKKTTKEKSKTIFQVLGYPEVSDDKFDQLFDISVKESKHNNQSGMAPSIGLASTKARIRSWLDDSRIRDIGWGGDEIKTYRDRYITYLSAIGRNRNYIQETKRSSLAIVSKLGDPEADHPFFVRGLVVGSVQSGKTANFNAVINSAIDVGYGLIIVLSGIMEDLRRQTQRRIEKEVVGKFENGVFVGVGGISSFGDSAYALHKDVRSISAPTSVDTDFKKSIKEVDFSLNNKNILVCKKNTSVLKNLLLWLHKYLNENKDKIRVPLLIVDDEADNASLNNLGEKGIEYASVINGHIRAILCLFEKKTYLGYTATPFGNILQDRHTAPEELWSIEDGGHKYEFEQTESLFPHDFIELLFPPPNYIGAKHFFETVGDDVKKIDSLIAPVITDHLSSFPARLDIQTGKPTTLTGKGTRAAGKYDDFPVTLPRSLEEAVMCFVISTAIRLARKMAMFDSKLYQPHNTMLIHISRFVTWQSKTKVLTKAYVERLEEDLQNDNPADNQQVYGKFENIWNKHYAYIVANIRTCLPDEYEDEFLLEKTFSEIKPLLITVVQNIDVKAINSIPPKDTLEYPDGSEKTYIAIGGNRLSRGFTLEGLTINYFIRNTNLADTLLQMGRWFGYRPGYIDCCKLFTTSDALKKFNQTSVTIEDVEQQFIDMNKDRSNTPEKYALKILTHPGVLKITRSSILKNAKEIKFSYSDHLVQTTKFLIDKERIGEAWLSLCQHVSGLSRQFKILRDKDQNLEYFVYETQDVSDLFKFLGLPHSYCEDDLDEVRRYIEACNKNTRLTNWTIAIKAAGTGSTLSLAPMGFDEEIGLTRRGGPNPNGSQSELLDRFITESIFSAGGKSANILSGGKDFRLRLSGPQILEAEEEFRKTKFVELAAKYPEETERKVQERVRKMTIPEKAYRQKMTDREGVLVIYLMDLEEVFKFEGMPIVSLEKLRLQVDATVPLIGYAIGIPPVHGDIGANYLQSKFHTDEQDTDDDEYEDFEECLDEY